MNLVNATRFPAAYTLGLQPDARELLVVVAKGTFSIPKAGEEAAPAAVQAPLVAADVFTGEPGFSAAHYESDFAPRKPKCDVLLNGSAYAPGGRPAPRVTVSLQVASMTKAFDVVGNRGWAKSFLALAASRPVPFVKMGISYNNAFGGVDKSREPHRFYALNHAGVGYHDNLAAEAITGKLLPNTEERGREVTDPRGKYRPMALGPIGRAWQPRVGFAGTYDKNWLDNVSPFLPADFKDEYYQAAPADQQIPFPKGGEEVALVNLTPEGRVSFRLPKLDMPIEFFMKEGPAQAKEGVIDTILTEPDLGRFSISWRAHLPLRRSIFEVSQVVVGRMPRGWYRAKELGKVYRRSLAEAILFPIPEAVPEEQES